MIYLQCVWHDPCYLWFHQVQNECKEKRDATRVELFQHRRLKRLRRPLEQSRDQECRWTARQPDAVLRVLRIKNLASYF
jgi:hypothetical protein